MMKKSSQAEIREKIHPRDVEMKEREREGEKKSN